jgi:hypothetical protein
MPLRVTVLGEGTNTMSDDIRILRELGQRKVEIGSLPVQKQTADLWRRLNRLERVRPLVWINEIPWHELNDTGELTLQCADPFLKEIERSLRMELYQWAHFRCDMVVDPVWTVGKVCGPVGSYANYGIKEVNVKAADGHDVGFVPVIHTEADADQIRTPEVWYDAAETERRRAMLSEVFDGIMPVRVRGIVHQWHSPWDQIIHWYGIEQLYTDMYDRPELVHRILRNFSQALNAVLDRQEALGLLDTSDGNYRVGSGGLGFTDQLPPPDGAPALVRPRNQWGCSTGQIFSEVSPEMHEEFCLQYERPTMERFGLTYYGCCEPLHRKLGILRSVRNLRKISMSPWINLAEASEAMGADYVFSYKPNPSFVAMDHWDSKLVRDDLERVVRATQGNRVELIFKDITTVRRQPRRLEQWAEAAMQVARNAG